MDAVIALNAARIVRKHSEDRRDLLCVRLQVCARATVGDRGLVSGAAERKQRHMERRVWRTHHTTAGSSVHEQAVCSNSTKYTQEY